jgi:hypothetical protein
MDKLNSTEFEVVAEENETAALYIMDLEKQNAALMEAIKVVKKKHDYIKIHCARFNEKSSRELAKKAEGKNEKVCSYYNGSANAWEVVHGLMEETEQELKQALKGGE